MAPCLPEFTLEERFPCTVGTCIKAPYPSEGRGGLPQNVSSKLKSRSLSAEGIKLLVFSYFAFSAFLNFSMRWKLSGSKRRTASPLCFRTTTSFPFYIHAEIERLIT